MEGNPTGCMGLTDYLGWDWKSKAGIPIVNVPGCPVQPDNFMETVLYLLYQVAGLAPMIPLDDRRAARSGCSAARCTKAATAPRYYEQGDFATRIRIAQVHRQAGLLGAGGELQCAQARLDGRHRRLPERGRHLHRLHHAGLPRQVHAVHGRAARQQDVHRRGRASTAGPSAPCGRSPTAP